MRAVRFHAYGPPAVLVVDDVPRPEPRAGEVLIRVQAAGVNPIDWKFRAGYLQQFVPLELPSIPGLDVAGTVEALGPGVAGLAPGQAVFGRGSGTYAMYALAPVTSLARKPEGVSFEEAATIAVGGVSAWVGLFDRPMCSRGNGSWSRVRLAAWARMPSSSPSGRARRWPARPRMPISTLCALSVLMR